jgi:inosine-uridine nucleoside N-ribohydrolase
MKRKIIIDTDPGHDDMMAILLAARHLDVLGLTTVNGNSYIDKVTTNALKIVEFSGLTHIPVIRGAAMPLVQPLQVSPLGHGVSGLDGLDLPESVTRVKPGHAVNFIVDTVMSTDDVSLVPIGPLTNIALALRLEPRIAGRVREISLMGGSTTVGNRAPMAETNVVLDPEAAHIVFSSGIPIKMAGLNLTRQALSTPDRMERLRRFKTRVGEIVCTLLDWYNENTRKRFGLPGAAIHDACSVAWLIDPSLVESVDAHVDVELCGKLTRGMTVCDLRFLALGKQGSSGGGGIAGSKEPNVQIGMKIDSDRFFDLLIDAIGRYS